MNKLLLLAGIGCAAYGVYLLCRDKNGILASEEISVARITKIQPREIVPDVVLKQFDTSWHSLFPTPKREMGIGALSTDSVDDAFAAKQVVEE